MKKFAYLLSVFLIFALPGSNAAAEDRTLTAEEIVDLLTGNTAVGTWIDHEYRQYFDKHGQTIYAQRGQRSSLGKWRVNRKHNHYESWWERVDWGAGFSIVQRDGVYYWVSSTGTTDPQAFEILEGSQLLFPE